MCTCSRGAQILGVVMASLKKRPRLDEAEGRLEHISASAVQPAIPQLAMGAQCAGPDVTSPSGAAQPADQSGAVVLHSLLPQSRQDTAVPHSLLRLSPDMSALLPCTELAGEATKTRKIV